MIYYSHLLPHITAPIMDTSKQLQTSEDNGCTSPSLEFSFITSLHPSPPPMTPPLSPLRTTRTCPNDSTSRNSVSTVDIFLDEQLIIPVQVESKTEMSSHNSDMSREKSFTLSVERIESDLGQRYSIRSNTSSKSQENSSKPKLKSLSSIFRLGSRENKTEETEKKEENKSRKNKKRLDLGQVWKKYISIMENFFYNKGERERRDLRRRPYSFSGNTNLREMEKWRKRKLGQRSAPASMRTSPANSGHFTGSSINKLSSSSDESTMEEFQNAIQAAIAHCKSSIAAKAEQV
ncbi:hypothetical protein LUZ60_002719 [Juncus effusus]|nr:hypothetical protein LUZ60_002719 [Juncus effusus]